jgi:hypothetical protein
VSETSAGQIAGSSAERSNHVDSAPEIVPDSNMDNSKALRDDGKMVGVAMNNNSPGSACGILAQMLRE